MLYRRTDDVERLQKLIADTEQQFIDCFLQIKTLDEEKEQCQKDLEDLRRASSRDYHAYGKKSKVPRVQRLWA
jgi:hypothetical protein